MKKISKVIISTIRFARKMSCTKFSATYLFIKLMCARLVWKLIKNRLYIFKFCKQGVKFEMQLRNSTDYSIVQSVFVYGEYEYEKNIISKPEIIVDLGGHIGETAIYFALMYPNATIYTIEASNNNYKLLKRNVSRFEKIITINQAISSSNEDVYMDESSNSSLGYSVSYADKIENNQTQKAQGTTLDNLCKQNNINKIDVLKFDIEGAEEYILEDDFVLSAKVKYLVGEVHYSLMDKDWDILLEVSPYKIEQEKIINKQRKLILATNKKAIDF